MHGPYVFTPSTQTFLYLLCSYLNRKKQKKKGKGGKVEEGTLLECCLRDRGKVGFGETSDRPLEVNLKRKHFVNQERTASDRCKVSEGAQGAWGLSISPERVEGHVFTLQLGLDQ